MCVSPPTFFELRNVGETSRILSKRLVGVLSVIQQKIMTGADLEDIAVKNFDGRSVGLPRDNQGKSEDERCQALVTTAFVVELDHEPHLALDEEALKARSRWSMMIAYEGGQRDLPRRA